MTDLLDAIGKKNKFVLFFNLRAAFLDLDIFSYLRC